MTTHLLTPTEFAPLAQSLRGAERLYIDTEFHPEHRYTPRLYLLQVAADDGPVHLVDCADTEGLDAVADALCSAPWVVHGGHHDIEILHRVLGRVPDVVWDTQILAGLVQSAFPSPFARLVPAFTGAAVDKGATLTNWKRRPLSAEQLAYAAADIIQLRPLFAALYTKIQDAGRQEVALNACAAARAEAIAGTPPLDAWRSFGAARVLDPMQASRLRELAAWREEQARQTNQPPRTVLHDGMLLELARRRPTRIEDMTQNRRFSSNLVKRLGDELLTVLAKGEARQDDDPVPLVQRFSADALLVDWIETVVRLVGERDGWAADLLLSRPLLWDLVLAPRTPADIDRLLGWRAPLVGDVLFRALAGDLHVSRTADGWSIR